MKIFARMIIGQKSLNLIRKCVNHDLILKIFFFQITSLMSILKFLKFNY